MKPSDETKKFWLMLYSIESFRSVVVACDYLIDHDLPVDAPLYRPIVTAIFTMYGRPFHKNRGVEKLDEVIIPQDYLDLHRQLISERDKIHAHTDSIGMTTQIGNANQVRLLRTREGFTWTTWTWIRSIDDIRRIKNLCKTLIEKFDYHTDKYEKKCLKEIGALSEGEYLLNTDNTANELFTRVEKIIPPDRHYQTTKLPRRRG